VILNRSNALGNAGASKIDRIFNQSGSYVNLAMIKINGADTAEKPCANDGRDQANSS
jgi:hypothetical protein